MKLEQKVQKAMNEQINKELFSSYLYLSMSAWCESEGYPGCAKWLGVQSTEENEHAIKILHFIHERGSRVELEAIEKPKAEFKNLASLFNQVLEHEQKVSASITSLYETAMKGNDYPSQIMLQWFITEQVEEEKNANEIVDLLKKVGDSPVSLMMFDRQLGARTGK
ncbi:MAG: ferritin [Bacteriovoracaceae bacterium]|nr:ferritin [Bacteroidota bacterium]